MEIPDIDAAVKTTRPGGVRDAVAKVRRFLFTKPAGFVLLASSGAFLTLFGIAGLHGGVGKAAFFETAFGVGALLAGLEGAIRHPAPSKIRFRALARLMPAFSLLATAMATSGLAGPPLAAFSPTLLVGLAFLVLSDTTLVAALVMTLAPTLLWTAFAVPAAPWLNFCLGLVIAASVRFFQEIRHIELRTALDEVTTQLNAKREVETELHRSQQRVLKRYEHLYENLFESTPDIIFTLQPDGRIASLNPGFETITGLCPKQWIGRPLTDLLHPSDQQKAGEVLAKVLQGENASTLETRFLSKSQKFLYGDLALKPQIEEGRVVGALGIARDVTEGKRYAKALQDFQDIEERFSLIASGARDGLWDWNIRTRRFYYSPRWKQMLDYRDEEISSSPEEWFGRVHPEDIAELRAAILRHLHGQTPHFEATYRIRNKEKTYRWMACRALAVRDSTGSAYRMVGSQTDITEFKAAEEQLTRDLSRDPLTGLANRARLLESLAASLEKAKEQTEYRFALLVMNLDRFKLLNDSMGHEAGDQLLELAARRLESCVRNGDLVARLGGDEFAVLADSIRDEGHAVRIAERIQKGFKNSLNLRGQRFFVTAGIGVAVGRRDHRKPTELLRDATMAMSRAKAEGKGGVAIFDFEMRAQAVERLLMENDIRRALKRREFLIHYQPIVSLPTTEIVGFEALLRWQHPDQGLIPPGEFLNLAEETGLIVPLGWWVLEQACRQTRSWQEQFVIEKPLALSVNFSAKNLNQPDAPERTAKILEESGLAPGDLRLEVGEDALFKTDSIEPMKRLKALGLQFYLDDFGKGVYPLGNLRQFPLDAAKIDCSFVGRIGQSPGNTQVVQAMVGLSHSLGLKVVAEGVETADQAAQLRLLRCELAQGFLYSKPLEPAAVERLLSSLYGTRGAAQQCTLPVYAVPNSS